MQDGIIIIIVINYRYDVFLYLILQIKYNI